MGKRIQGIQLATLHFIKYYNYLPFILSSTTKFTREAGMSVIVLYMSSPLERCPSVL
jgi:hypothetical protein